MLKIKEYVKAESLEQAYELNQKKTNCVIGGMLWLKMVTRNVQKAIDLSGLGLDQIEENDEEFSIGAMVTLRQIELHEGLNTWSQGAVKESVTHIVGVQFRNLATVGGSIFGKFGFSDVLSCFLAFDSYVELHHEGLIPLDQFAANKYPNDILVRLIIKKHPQESVYLSHRNTKTDFPVLTCAVSLGEKEAYAVVGARPSRACRVRLSDQWMEQIKDDEGRKKLADEVTGQMNFGSNMRGSAAYREQLSKVLLRRGFEQLEERERKINMEITFTLNGKKITPQIDADTLLIDLVRDLGCYSVKRGCETSNCGLCTVFMDDQPILSCSILAARVDGHKIDTLEGLQEEAAEFGAFIANQGAEQCGFCNPGMIMNAIALFREIPDPSEEEIKEYLAGESFADVLDMKDSFEES